MPEEGAKGAFYCFPLRDHMGSGRGSGVGPVGGGVKLAERVCVCTVPPKVVGPAFPPQQSPPPSDLHRELEGVTHQPTAFPVQTGNLRPREGQSLQGPLAGWCTWVGGRGDYWGAGEGLGGQ